jgi:hypothetical protein
MCDITYVYVHGFYKVHTYIYYRCTNLCTFMYVYIYIYICIHTHERYILGHMHTYGDAWHCMHKVSNHLYSRSMCVNNQRPRSKDSPGKVDVW